MSDQSHTTADTSADDGSDSSVIRELRDQLKAERAARKAAESRASEVADAIRAEVKREQAAVGIVNDLGYPKLASLVAEKVEGDLTVEAVGEFLASIGLEAKSGDSSGREDSDRTAQDVGKVADLGSQVAAAASGQSEGDLEKRIAAAESPAQIAALMAEAGLLKSH